MSDVYEQIDDLYEQAFELPDGPTKSSMLEEAVRLADSRGDLEMQYETRMDFIDASFSSGDADKMLVAISWCISMHGRHPDRFDDESLLNACQYALAYISSFPDVSREQIHGLLDDVEERHRALGISPRTINRCRFFNSFWLGDTERALEYMKKMKSSPKDTFWEGEVWERLVTSDGYIRMFQYERAYQEARPTLDASHTSQDSYLWLASFMLLPLVRLGRFDEARRAHLRAYPMIDNNPKFVELAGDHLGYLAVVNDLSRALGLLERHLNWALEAASIRSAFQFYVSALMLCYKLASNGTSQVAIRLPDALDLSRNGRVVSTSKLRDWLETETSRLEKKFNERNGNEFFSEIVRQNLELVGVKKP